MDITLSRLWLTSASTCGELSIDGARYSYTLELPNKDGKPGSCIPAGCYKLIVWNSPHFARLMPRIIGIPGRDMEQIEIHWGNWPRDTHGCVLLGFTHEQDFVGESKAAFDAFWAKAQGPIERGECHITITGGAQVQPVNFSEVMAE